MHSNIMPMIFTHTHVQDYLKGASFPIDKRDSISTAIENEAPEEMFEILDLIPDATYENLLEIMREATHVEFPDWDKGLS